MKLHQHRRLTRAQSHHGSEEEKKRRKMMARKVGDSLPHTTIQRHQNVNINKHLGWSLVNFALRLF